MRSTASGFREPPHLRDHASDIAQAYFVPKARSDSVKLASPFSPTALPPLFARFPHAPPASTLPPSLCLRLYRLSWRLQTFAPPRASWHGPRPPARQWTPCALEG